MKYYAVIDTNVLVSAMLRLDSVPGNVITAILRDEIIPVLHQDIVREYREVLMRPKFHFTEQIVSDVISSLEEKGFYIEAEQIDVELPDPKDRIFYEVVMEEKKDEDAYLVTGNIKHFPDVSFIVTPRQMLDIIYNKE